MAFRSIISLLLFCLVASCAGQDFSPARSKVNEITLSSDVRERLTRQLIERTARLSEADREADLVLLATSSSKKSGEPYVVRWLSADPIGYSVDSRSPGDRALVDAQVAKLNAVLEPLGYRLVNDEASPAIRIHFIPLASFMPRAAADYSKEIVSRRDEFNRLSQNIRGIALPKWRRHGRNLHSVLMMIDEDLRGELRGQVVLHEFMHALGVSGHPERVVWSVLRKEAIIAGLTDLSEFDRLLIRLMYKEARPGDDPDKLRKAIRRDRQSAPQTVPAQPVPAS